MKDGIITWIRLISDKQPIG